VERRNIVSTLSSNGTVSAVTAVQAGSQVSGRIKELFADFNPKVQQGQIITRIDPENFGARALQAEAELSGARATAAIHKVALERARAGLDNSGAVLMNARRDVRSKLKTHPPAWHSLHHPGS
jgi:HlyD family secretion protein